MRRENKFGRKEKLKKREGTCREGRKLKNKLY